MSTPRLVIVDGIRTPFVRAGTEFAGLGADELGRVAVDALLTRTGFDPALVDEVIFGCVSQPPEAANVARVIALRAGLPEEVPAATVHRNCASGFEALTTAFERMAAGVGSVFVVGGTESMSRVPLLFRDEAARKLATFNKSKTTRSKIAAISEFRPVDFTPRAALKLGLTDPISGLNMGETAEVLARENHLTREAQDAFAIRSHQRAQDGEARLAEEICPVYVPGKAITRDNGPRLDQTPAVLAALNPVFDKYGTVTAGNSSQITDGAVALLVMTEERAAAFGLTPLGVLTGYAYAGTDPARMGLGPVAAIDRAAKRTGLLPADADLVEINEAFAAQVLSVLQRVPIPDEKLNVNGGAIALGHPVGASGARLVLTALKELRRRGGKRALVTLCVGGGQGGAIWLERP